MGVLNAKIGTEWVPISAGQSNVDHWNTAWGVVAQGSFKTGIANPVLVTGTAVEITEPLAVTMQSGRRYRIVCQLRAVNGTSAAVSMRLSPYDNGVSKVTPWGDWYCNAVTTTAAYDALETGFIVDGDGASHSVTIQAESATAGTAQAHWNQNCRYYIQDIGPVTRLAAGATPPASDWTAYDARYINTNELGVGQNWTPTLTGWALGNGSAAGRYIRLGSFIWVMGTITFGSSSTYVGTLGISLPVTPHPSSIGLRTAINVDVFRGSMYPGRSALGATFFNVILTGTTATYLTDVVFLAAGVPGTWTSGDGIAFSGMYEAA